MIKNPASIPPLSGDHTFKVDFDYCFYIRGSSHRTLEQMSES
jgi:hypothetical protein